VPRIATRDGRKIEFEPEGDGELVFAHANGFCKEVWHPVLEELDRPGYVSIDQPGHGGSDPLPPPIDWWDFAHNVLAVLDHIGSDEPIGVGHSSGAAALAMAEIARPGTFARLVLVEPIIFPGPHRRQDDHPLVRSALRRRVAFESRDAVMSSYRGRGPFVGWDERALLAYATHGFEATPAGWTLRCSPEVEAEGFRAATAHGAWERLGEIACPVDLVAGVGSDTHFEEFARRQAGRFRRSTLHMVPDANHFVPMQRPAELARIIR
jgi:pimeloyl-ACP methyl ester carboxylesterase